jgi:hypothetical protein
MTNEIFFALLNYIRVRTLNGNVERELPFAPFHSEEL